MRKGQLLDPFPLCRLLESVQLFLKYSTGAPMRLLLYRIRAVRNIIQYLLLLYKTYSTRCTVHWDITILFSTRHWHE